MKILTKYKKENEKQETSLIQLKNRNILKVLKYLLRLLKNNIIFILGTILLVYKGSLLNYTLGLQMDKYFYINVSLVSLLIMSPTINKKNKFAYLYLNIIYFMLTLLIYSNFLYYSYSTNFLSLYQIENLIYAKEIGVGITSIINIKDLIIFIYDNIIIMIYTILRYKKINNNILRKNTLKPILISIIFLSNIFIVKYKINNIYESKRYNKSLIIQDSSIYYYHYADAKDYFTNMFIKEPVDEERISNIYNKNLNNKVKSTEYTGIAKECNVIILQLESLNEYVINKSVNGKEITPNLNKFFNENIYCKNMYNQGLGTTADSEFEMENSMYPLENGYVFQKYYSNTWQDIYTTLKNEDYYTSFMHPNVSTYWNRDEVYNKGYKIDEYYDINKFDNIEEAGGFYSDEGFFEEAVNIMSSYKEKFCTTLVSVTTHIPFELTGISNLEEKLTITYDDVKEYDDAIYKNYLISCNFVDYAFGKFINMLEQANLLQNSILVVYGDHGAGMTTVEDIERLYNENSVNYNQLEEIINDVHIPFGIKIPGILNKSTIQRAVSKIDIKPTILDLLGVEDKFSLGETIFSDKDYSFIKGLGYITSNNYCINDKCYDRETLKEIQKTEDIQKLIKKMEDEIYLSDMIIKHNLIKNIKE